MVAVSKLYTIIQQSLFPMLQAEIGEPTERQKFFVAMLEAVKPSRFITQELCWSGFRRPMKEREYVFRASII